MTAIRVEPLADTVGAEVIGVDRDRLAHDDAVAVEVLDALDANGVLVFRDLHLPPDEQVAFCRKLGAVDEIDGHHPVRGIYRVTLDKTKNPTADYLHGTFYWHIDGCTPFGDDYPQMATVLSAKAVSTVGGDTEFASTYAAWDDLTVDEQEQLVTLRVLHTLEASQRCSNPNPSDAQLARWRKHPSSEHPLVWTHRSGRRSLVLGASTDHVTGMAASEGRALLDDLLARATVPTRVYRHKWSVGDTVIWDNRGVLHRAEPYDPDSAREMLRTTVLGDEPIQ